MLRPFTSRRGALRVALAPLVLAASRRVVAAAEDTVIAIENFAFLPSRVTIAAGTAVQWINRDGEAHAVATAGSKMVHSPALDEGECYRVVFTEPGVYAYYCTLHPHMTGTVEVR